ncbi:hypothetical protein CDAR_189181 [Caerostris darwini]|uniref:DUF4795 domain-containing protein n=1 Tax=Caerostris darwini TaxID=1538125 RepID=A0AAV4SQ34_9ARAC|nr:hypothetical protein CDAR_189181 [Caerostris darwini]
MKFWGAQVLYNITFAIYRLGNFAIKQNDHGGSLSQLAMLQNSYNLLDLLDLALKVPEVGAVNFNILYTVLQTMINELKLQNVRPYCHIESPLLAKSALMKEKLQTPAVKEKAVYKEAVREQQEPPPSPEPETEPVPQGNRQDSFALLVKRLRVNNVKSFVVVVVVVMSLMEEGCSFCSDGAPVDAIFFKAEQKEESTESPTTETASGESQEISTESTSEEAESKPEEEESEAEGEESSSSEEEESSESSEEEGEGEEPKRKKPKKKEPESQEPKSRREAAGWDDVTEEIKVHRKSVAAAPDEKAPEAKTIQQVRDAWNYTTLDTRVAATEEGMMRLTDIIDMIADKIRKAEARRKPGEFSIADMELLEERVEELEEARAVFDQDHLILKDTFEKQKEMEAEFTEIKLLGGQIEEMKTEISTKADAEEMEEQLALKGDLSLVMTKVDYLEFETAIDELGEAIGLLGIKFMRKNDEWEERSAEMWKGIDGKMSRDVFDEAIVHVNSRLTALMYGLKKMRKVIENLLYPDASGVTRCICCRRPSGVSGQEQESAYSPKRPFKPGDDESDNQRFLNAVDAAVSKRPKLDGPPYCVTGDTIISIPYTSTTYRTSNDEATEVGTPDLKIRADHKSPEGAVVRKSQVPKLPKINGDTAQAISPKLKRGSVFTVPKLVQGHKELVFTQKVLERYQKEGKKEIEKPQQPLPSTSSRERLMQDPLRREIIINPPQAKEYKPPMVLAPLIPDIASYQDSSTQS